MQQEFLEPKSKLKKVKNQDHAESVYVNPKPQILNAQGENILNAQQVEPISIEDSVNTMNNNLSSPIAKHKNMNFEQMTMNLIANNIPNTVQTTNQEVDSLQPPELLALQQI